MIISLSQRSVDDVLVAFFRYLIPIFIFKYTDAHIQRKNKVHNITKIETTPVFYFVYNCANYFHWIYDTVPYLYSYFELKKRIGELKLLVNFPEGEDDLYSFVYETLNLLGIEKKDLIFIVVCAMELQVMGKVLLPKIIFHGIKI